MVGFVTRLFHNELLYVVHSVAMYKLHVHFTGDWIRFLWLKLVQQEPLMFIHKTTRALFRLVHFPLLLMVFVTLHRMGEKSACHLAL
jgi:hypothetical protein